MFGSVRRRRCKSVLRSASAACLLLGVFMVATPQSAEAGGGQKTRAQSSQVAHSARKKNEGAATATSENRRVAQAQHARDARRQAESIQKRARGDKLRKEAAAQKKIADDAAAAATAKKQVADRKLKREEQTRKAKIEHERQLKLAAQLKAAAEEEDRLRGVAEREAAVYEARRKEVAHIVEGRQKLVATAKKLQQERQTRSISTNRVGTTVPATAESATAPLVATLDSSKGLRRDRAAGSSPGKDTAAPSGYCDRDGKCEGGEWGSGGSRVWLSDSGDVDAMQERLANKARERAAHNENAQKYLQAHQAQAAAKADERKRNEAAAAAMHSDRARAERQAAAHIAAAAATVAVKAAASESGLKKSGGSTQELQSPTSKEQASALPTATADRGRRKPPSDKTGRKVREDAANKVRLLKAKEMFETAKKIALETIAAEKAEKAKAAKAAADVAIAAAAAAAAAFATAAVGGLSLVQLSAGLGLLLQTRQTNHRQLELQATQLYFQTEASMNQQECQTDPPTSFGEAAGAAPKKPPPGAAASIGEGVPNIPSVGDAGGICCCDGGGGGGVADGTGTGTGD